MQGSQDAQNEEDVGSSLGLESVLSKAISSLQAVGTRAQILAEGTANAVISCLQSTRPLTEVPSCSKSINLQTSISKVKSLASRTTVRFDSANTSTFDVRNQIKSTADEETSIDSFLTHCIKQVKCKTNLPQSQFLSAKQALSREEISKQSSRRSVLKAEKSLENPENVLVCEGEETKQNLTQDIPGTDEPQNQEPCDIAKTSHHQTGKTILQIFTWHTISLVSNAPTEVIKPADVPKPVDLPNKARGASSRQPSTVSAKRPKPERKGSYDNRNPKYQDQEVGTDFNSSLLLRRLSASRKNRSQSGISRDSLRPANSRPLASQATTNLQKTFARPLASLASTNLHTSDSRVSSAQTIVTDLRLREIEAQNRQRMLLCPSSRSHTRRRSNTTKVGSSSAISYNKHTEDSSSSVIFLTYHRRLPPYAVKAVHPDAKVSEHETESLQLTENTNSSRRLLCSSSNLRSRCLSDLVEDKSFFQAPYQDTVTQESHLAKKHQATLQSPRVNARKMSDEPPPARTEDNRTQDTPREKSFLKSIKKFLGKCRGKKR